MASKMDVDTGAEECKSQSQSFSSAATVTVNKVGGKGGGRNVLLHPLAIISISDHFTRVSTGGGQIEPTSKVIGLLFGVQTGLDVRVLDATEVIYTVGTSGDITIDPDSVRKQKELYSAVFPDYEILGWYGVASVVVTQDLALQRVMSEFNPNPLYMLMNPRPVPGAKELPVVIHESEVHVVNGKPTMLFAVLPFTLEATQAEQISVENVAKATPTEGVSSIELNTTAVTTSLRTLKSRVAVLMRFLQETKDGTIPPDYALLRQVSSLANQLPAAGPGAADFGREFQNDYTDTLLLTYMAGVQKNMRALSDLYDKYYVAGYNDRHHRPI